MKRKIAIFGLLLAILVAAFVLRTIGAEDSFSKWPAIFGTLMVLGIFLLAGELFQNRVIGLVSAYIAAFSYWATSSMQTRSDSAILPLILTFSFYFLFRGLRSRQLPDFIISGLVFGLGFYEPAVFNFFPFILVVLLLSFIITDKKFLTNHWKHIFVFAVAMIISIILTQASMIDIKTKNEIMPFGSFSFIRLLNPFVSISFLAGLFYIIVKFIHTSWHHFQKRDLSQKIRAYIFLLTWLFLPIFFEIFFGRNTFPVSNYTTILPVVMIISAIPFFWIMKKYHSFGHAYRILITSALIAIFAFIGIYDMMRYFVFLQNNKIHNITIQQ